MGCPQVRMFPDQDDRALGCPCLGSPGSGALGLRHPQFGIAPVWQPPVQEPLVPAAPGGDARQPWLRSWTRARPGGTASPQAAVPAAAWSRGDPGRAGGAPPHPCPARPSAAGPPWDAGAGWPSSASAPWPPGRGTAVPEGHPRPPPAAAARGAGPPPSPPRSAPGCSGFWGAGAGTPRHRRWRLAAALARGEVGGGLGGCPPPPAPCRAVSGGRLAWGWRPGGCRGRSPHLCQVGGGSGGYSGAGAPIPGRPPAPPGPPSGLAPCRRRTNAGARPWGGRQRARP